uniref:Uncharacterized protein n=1 Tax=Arundo donax TaxID=35708 RepID=A0A0A8XTG5_ARUDO
MHSICHISLNISNGIMSIAFILNNSNSKDNNKTSLTPHLSQICTVISPTYITVQ